MTEYGRIAYQAAMRAQGAHFESDCDGADHGAHAAEWAELSEESRAVWVQVAKAVREAPE